MTDARASRRSAARSPRLLPRGRARITRKNGTLLGFWLYLMSDCLDLRVPVRDLRRARRQLRGRPDAARICSTCHWWRSTPRCCCCRPSPMASPCWRCSKGASAQTLAWLVDHRPVRRRLHRHRAHEFAHLIHEGAAPSAQRFSVLVLHAGRHARPARDLSAWSGW